MWAILKPNSTEVQEIIWNPRTIKTEEFTYPRSVWVSRDRDWLFKNLRAVPFIRGTPEPPTSNHRVSKTFYRYDPQQNQVYETFEYEENQVPTIGLHDTLNDARAYGGRLIDEKAEQIRARFITPGSGQALSYMMKRISAEEVLNADLKGESVDAPMIDVLVGIEINPETKQPFENRVELAAHIVASSFKTEMIEATIDAARRITKIAISKAEDQPTVDRLVLLGYAELERASKDAEAI